MTYRWGWSILNVKYSERWKQGYPCGGIAPLILNLDTRWRVQRHAPAALRTGNESPVPTEQHSTCSWPGQFRNRKVSCSWRVLNRVCSDVQPSRRLVTIPTEPSRLVTTGRTGNLFIKFRRSLKLIGGAMYPAVSIVSTFCYCLGTKQRVLSKCSILTSHILHNSYRAYSYN
jgi:hypothetical protein